MSRTIWLGHNFKNPKKQGNFETAITHLKLAQMHIKLTKWFGLTRRIHLLGRNSKKSKKRGKIETAITRLKLAQIYIKIDQLT